MTWHPIETAPSDRLILVYCKNWHQELVVCKWDEMMRSIVWENPTHWMELPEPPRED